MRKLLLLILLAAVTACEMDDYGKGEGQYSLVRADFAQAHVGADKAIDYIVTDDGNRLSLSIPFTAKWLTTASTTERVLIYYRDRGTQAEVVSVSQVPVAQIQHRVDSEKTAETDPVKLESMWLSKNRRYLNANIILMMGSTDEAEAKHHLGVVRDSTLTHPDGRSTLCLRLLHNQGGVPEYYSYSTYFSIPLSDITTDSVCLSVNTYSGLVSKTFSIDD